MPALDLMLDLQLDGGRGLLLSDYLLLLNRSLTELSVAEVPHVVEATRCLIAACLAPSRDRFAEAQKPIDTVVMERARRFIGRRLADPDLTPEMLCAELGVSRSRLYRLFESLGGISAYIRRQRLLKTRDALSDSSDRRSISRIAEEWGFTDPSAYSRTFRHEFGMSPSEAREEGWGGYGYVIGQEKHHLSDQERSLGHLLQRSVGLKESRRRREVLLSKEDMDSLLRKRCTSYVNSYLQIAGTEQTSIITKVERGSSHVTSRRSSFMSDKPKKGLDRRDLISGLHCHGRRRGRPRGQRWLCERPGLGGSRCRRGIRPQGTVYTGDVIQGKKVVSALDVNDLEPGQKHLLYFQGVQMPTGQHWYVSVTVAKGAKPGKRVVLISGVHGDEMSSMHTVQTVMNQLDPAQMSGTVMAVTDVARPAIESMQRRWPNSGRGIDLIDMNRVWPGNENDVTAPSRHAGLLFNRLLRPNADFAIDFHTGTTGFEVCGIQYCRDGRARGQGDGWSSTRSARSSTILHIPVSSITRLSPRASRPFARRSALPATWTSR